MSKDNQKSVLELIQKKSQKIASKLVKIRRHLHQNPELSYQEFETSKYLMSLLKQAGAEIRTEYADTGVVGIIQGDMPGAVVALRGDIDALPIEEQTRLSFASQAQAHLCQAPRDGRRRAGTRGAQSPDASVPDAAVRRTAATCGDFPGHCRIPETALGRRAHR